MRLYLLLAVLPSNTVLMSRSPIVLHVNSLPSAANKSVDSPLTEFLPK